MTQGLGHPGEDARAPRSIVPRLLVEARPFWPRIAFVLFLYLLATPLVLLGPIPLKVAVDSVIGSHPLPGFLDPVVPGFVVRSDVGLLLLVAALQVLVVLLIQLQSAATYVAGTQIGERMTLAFRSRLFRHSQRLSLGFHDSRGTMDSIFRIQYDAPALRHVTIDGLIPFVSAGFMLVAMFATIARIDWQLALVALGVAPLLAVYARSYNRRMRPRYASAAALESSALGVVQEVLTAFRVVKAFSREDGEQERFVRHSGESTRARIRLAIVEGAFGLLVHVTIAFGTGAVLLVGIRNVQSGVLTLGELLVVIAYLAQLYGPLQTISQQAANLQGSLASAQRAFELLDAVPDVFERPDARPLMRARGRLELRDVTFAYEGGDPVLRDVSFTIEPGVRVGLAGRTGAGKTTLVSLLMRFYDPTSGAVVLDGIDLRDIRLGDLRNQFALVLQEPVLFSRSIAENIAYARPEATAEEVAAAADAASAHEFILRLPEGYDTLVGERGMRLSGGERQRIALARAFLKDAPILILDEPTSSVDVKTEAAIIEAMERLMAGRTTLMIAHRLSTLDVCDVRIELEDGRVRAPGDARVAAEAR